MRKCQTRVKHTQTREAREVAARVAESGHNISQVNMQDRPEENTELFLSVLVKDRDRLARVIRAVRTVPSVHRV